MSTTRTTTRWTYPLDAGGNDFIFDNLVQTADDLLIRAYNPQGNSLTLPSSTINGVGDPNGGTVHFNTDLPATAAAILVIERRTGRVTVGGDPQDYIQDPAATRGFNSDQRLLLGQEHFNRFLRTVQMSLPEPSGPLRLPVIPERANRLLGCDQDGNIIAVDNTQLTGTDFALANKAALQTTHVPSAICRVYLLCYTTPANDGAGYWDAMPASPAAVQPYHAQSADGRWWQISRNSQLVVPAMYGYPGMQIGGPTTVGGLPVGITPDDPWDTIMGDLQSGQTLYLDDGIYQRSTSAQIAFVAKGRIDITAINPGHADINACFLVQSMGRLRFNGIHFFQLADDGPQDDIFEYLNSVLELNNCSAVSSGAGRMTNGKGNTQLTLDPGDLVDASGNSRNRDMLFDWTNSTAYQCFMQEENCEVFVRGGKVYIAGVQQAYRRRVVIKIGVHQSTALYVLTGNLYMRSPCVRGAGTAQGNGIRLARHAHGYLYTYAAGPASPGLTFRDPGYTYEDADGVRECGVRNFRQGIVAVANAKLMVNTQDAGDADDTTDPGTSAAFVFRDCLRAMAIYGGEIALRIGGVTFAGSITDRVFKNEVVDSITDHGPAIAIHTDVTVSTTLTKSDMGRTILADATAGPLNIDLPPSTWIDGERVTVCKDDASANTVKVRSSALVDLVTLTAQYDEATFVYWNGTWRQRKF